MGRVYLPLLVLNGIDLTSGHIFTFFQGAKPQMEVEFRLVGQVGSHDLHNIAQPNVESIRIVDGIPPSSHLWSLLLLQ